MTREPASGDLVVFRTLNHGGVARVDLVRDRHLTAFPWRQADRRWARSRSRIDRRDVVAILPRDADPAPIADEFNVLRNRRDAHRMVVEQEHKARVEQLVAQLGKRA